MPEKVFSTYYLYIIIFCENVNKNEIFTIIKNRKKLFFFAWVLLGIADRYGIHE
jgi:hypothetical protein